MYHSGQWRWAAVVAAAAVLMHAHEQAPDRGGRIADSYGKLPLVFEKNIGQTDSRVRFLARGSRYTVFLTPDSAVFSIATKRSDAVLRMKLLQTNPKPSISGTAALPGIANYLIGNDPRGWNVNVQTYAAVKYDRVYPGIDLVYHGNQGRLEYDFVVSPGADAGKIKLSLRGAESLRIDDSGDLRVMLGGGDVRFKAPVAYQEIGGRRQPVESGYVLRSRSQVAFRVGSYDRREPLIIDPTFVYATFLGGVDGSESAGIAAIAVDLWGNAYVAGTTHASQFPTTAGSLGRNRGTGYWTGFVCKLNPAGTGFVYSTYLGGTYINGAYGIAVDSTGNAFITGSTYSSDFPVTSGAYQTTKRSAWQSAFVSKLNATGTALLYSTYLDAVSLSTSQWPYGSAGTGITVDSSGCAYVVGQTGDTTFPATPGALQTALAGSADLFVSKLNATGSALLYSTFLGGADQEDWHPNIAVDSSGNAYVGGRTLSRDFPVTPGGIPFVDGGLYSANMFVSKLNPTGSALIYSTYVPGRSGVQASGMTIDANGNAYATGLATGQQDCGQIFVAKFSVNGSVAYSTDIGGCNRYFGWYSIFGAQFGITATSSGGVWVAGKTTDPWFPTTAGALQLGGIRPDAFLVKLSNDGSMLYSGLLGGSREDVAWALALDAASNVYVLGATNSADFPITPGALQSSFSDSSSDTGPLFIAKFGAAGVPPETAAAITGVAGNNGWYRSSATLTLSATAFGSSVAATYYSIDSGALRQYIGPVLLSAQGSHSFVFYSVDTAGRQEQAHQLLVRIDTALPSSRVSALPASESSPNFLVSWAGLDATSGVADYVVYVSDNGSPFVPWLSHTAASQFYYSGVLQHTYSFFSIARDAAGNEENSKASAEAATRVPLMAGDATGDGRIDCADIAVVKAAFGKLSGQPGFDPRADVNGDARIDIRDLSAVSQKLAPGTRCP